ncbi:DNA methyltransferase [Maledivibacter halophilus]|uniref:Site-specific DNA-methyltransferase (Adenine-specific) n=1 Tax=Maledivibacter halophilus TaxID=36842 RepID=A0A1T5MGB9_9FIRM|nr:site-specific DNA-methyltransferase [Maledivibacter halophilus]SKC86984.1 site-specific DNA-methyltransferase (adenine-specific) [Maledivibacter halophilus]
MMQEQLKVENYEFEAKKTIKGYPELHWTGKRPYRTTQYFPAQLKESYGYEKEGWMNKIFWGDNLQVMSHMLREYRGKIDLIYIDPPFDSKADYKKKIKLKGKKITNDNNFFEEKQYTDIWSNDEYLQFMYERLILLRELLSDTGSIYLHCDYRKVHHLRCIMDEVFGIDNFRNEISWCYTGPSAPKGAFPRKHDNILFYSKSKDNNFNGDFVEYKSGIHNTGQVFGSTDGDADKIEKLKERGKLVEDWWTDIYTTDRVRSEMLGYPTQKPEKLLERIIKASSNEGDIVFDCFMGSGTCQAIAMKLGRKFIGADINMGSIQITTKRLISLQKELSDKDDVFTGFEVYNVNNYDFFRNPAQAKELLVEALEIQTVDSRNIYDGEKDGRMVKIMPINRISTKADLEELKANFPYKTFEKRKAEKTNEPVEKLLLVCMGHEPDLKVSLEQELSDYKLDIEIVDILRDKSVLELKRDSEIEVEIDNGILKIVNFYPMNLLQKLSIQKEFVDDWRQLVESVMIDFNYDGAVMQPSITDITEKNEIVNGEYSIPKDAGTVRVKITDLLSESLEWEVKL